MIASDDRAWMRHPELPHNEPLAVVRSQIPHLAGAGWYEVEAPPPPPPPNDSADEHAPSAEPSAQPKPNKTPRRREGKSD